MTQGFRVCSHSSASSCFHNSSAEWFQDHLKFKARSLSAASTESPDAMFTAALSPGGSPEAIHIFLTRGRIRYTIEVEMLHCSMNELDKEAEV